MPKYPYFCDELNFQYVEREIFRQRLRESIELKEQLFDDPEFYAEFHKGLHTIVECFKRGGKLLLCGNGGSASDAQHISAELSGRFLKNRSPLSAEALHVNSSFVTAVANDFGYGEVFARGVEAFGRMGDVLILLSTSGNSDNILRAADKARGLGITTLALTGETGGALREKVDMIWRIPSTNTARIQEIHIFLGHLMCEYVEKSLFP